MRNHSDIQRVYRRGRRSRVPGLTVLDLANEGTDVRVAVVAGRKVGKSVERNRAKRKLRASAEAAPLSPGSDYILIADPDTTSMSVADLTGIITAHVQEGGE